MIDTRGIEAVGFDLDQTLYPDSEKIKDRVRNQIASKMLEERPELIDIRGARAYFEERYAIIGSGSRILEEIGYENPKQVMEQCLSDADVLDLIELNPTLTGILNELKAKYTTYLLTSGHEKLSNEKLARIGISPEQFYNRFYGDTPEIGSKLDGTAFQYAVNVLGIPAEKHVYVGDRLKSDILPAKKLGMQTIAVWDCIPEATSSWMHINRISDELL